MADAARTAAFLTRIEIAPADEVKARLDRPGGPRICRP